jgi:predicted dehydrogenase
MKKGVEEMRVLVSGSGSIGRRHMRNLRELGVRNFAACDPDTSRLVAIVDNLHVDVFDSFEAALDEFRPDIVFVCTPPVFHLAQARQAIVAGANVFVEKPLSHSMDGVRQLRAQIQQSGRIVQVGYNLRFHPAIRKLKQIVEEQSLGRILFARLEVAQYLPDWRPWQDYRNSYTARRELGGGIVLDGSHELDYLLWFMGDPDGVLCMAGTVSRLEVNVEDSATILLHFPSGAHADLHLDFVQRVPARSCKLVGELGTAWWDNTSPQMVHLHLCDSSPQSWEFAFEINDMYLKEVRDFLACIQEQRQPLVDIDQAARVLEWALSARHSAEAQAWSGVLG